MLAAFVRVRSDAGAQALTVPPAVAVAGVRQAVPVEPGHIHLQTTGGFTSVRSVCVCESTCAHAE